MISVDVACVLLYNQAASREKLEKSVIMENAAEIRLSEMRFLT